MSSTQFNDVDEKTRGILSEWNDAKVINNHFITYIMNKCADDVVLLCSVLENVVSSDKKKQFQNLGIIDCRYMIEHEKTRVHFKAVLNLIMLHSRSVHPII